MPCQTSLLFFHLFYEHARCMHVSTLRMLELFFFRGFVYICCLEFYKKSIVTNFLGIESIWFIRLKISCQNEVILFLISLLVILAGLFGSIRNNAYLPKYQEKVIIFPSFSVLGAEWYSQVMDTQCVRKDHIRYQEGGESDFPSSSLLKAFVCGDTRLHSQVQGKPPKDATATDSSVSINHPFLRLPQAVSVFAFWEKKRPEADRAKNLSRWHR